MDLNKYSSYLSLDPSALYAAQRLVERVVRYHGDEYEAMVQELEESLHGKTLEYAMELFEERIAEGLEYMGVKIAFNGKTYSAPTVGLYGVKSKPEIKAGIKAKVLARNEREQKEEYEVSLADKKGNTQAYKNYKAGMKNKLTGKPLYKAGKGVEEALDPVGQEDGDVNNDGKKDKTDKYLKNRRRAISKAIAAKEEHEIEALVDYFVTEQIAKSPEELDEIMFEIDEEHTEYFLEKAMELKGKKKGNVIINPKTEKMQEEEQSGQEKTQLANQKRMMAKKHMMDRQKMQLKKQGKLNVNAESVEMVNEVDYSGRPAKNDAESEKAKQYPTFAELKAKLAQAGDPAKGIPAGTQLPQTSLKKEEVEQVDEADTSDANRNSPAHRDRSNEGLSDRQIRMKKFAQKRAQMALNKEEVEDLDELYKGKHGQTEKQYQDSRSDAGKMVSGDSKHSGAAYSSRAVKNSGPNPAGGSKKPQGQGRMTSGARADLQYRKANMKAKKEEFEMDEATYPQDFKGGPVAKKKTGKPNAQGDYGKKDINEEDADRLRDQRMERGGVDGNTNYRKPAKFASGPSKKKYDGMSALDRVKSDIRAKYGKGAIMDTKKK